MVPTQLSPQRSDNLVIFENLSKLHHPAQTFFLKALAKLLRQLS
jgi:hypothetical protein